MVQEEKRIVKRETQSTKDRSTEEIPGKMCLLIKISNLKISGAKSSGQIKTSPIQI